MRYEELGGRLQGRPPAPWRYAKEAKTGLGGGRSPWRATVVVFFPLSFARLFPQQTEAQRRRGLAVEDGNGMEQPHTPSSPPAARWPWYRRLPIAAQLRYGLVLTVVAVQVAAAGLFLYFFHGYRETEIEEGLVQSSRAAADKIDAHLNDLKHKLDYLAQVPGLTELTPEMKTSLIETLMRQDSPFEALAILDTEGRTVCQTARPGLGPFQAAVEPALLADIAASGSAYVGPVEHDPKLRLPVMRVVVPLRNRQGDVQGVLLAVLNLRYLWSVVAQIKVGESGYIYILDEHGRVVAQRGAHAADGSAEDVSGPAGPGSPAWNPDLAAQSYTGLGGVTVRGAAANLRSLHGLAVAELPIREAEAPFRTMLVIVVLITLVEAALAAGLALFYSRQILRPLARLKEAAVLAGAGRLESRLAVEGQNELGVLAASFNDMSARLSRLIQDLRASEEALRESEGRHRSLTDDVLDSSAVGLIVLDRNFHVVWMNQGLERCFGGHRGELTGRDKRTLDRERLQFLFEDPEAYMQQTRVAYQNNTYTERFECHVLAGPGREERWLEHHSQPIRAGLYAGGRIEHYYDVTARKQAEAARLLEESRQAALLKLHQMAEAPLRQLTGFALEEGVRLTQSQVGYLAFLNEDETVLTVHAWSRHAMEQCATPDKPLVYPVATTGLWGEAVRQRRPVITNDYGAPDSHKKGYPPGHVPILRHMNVPVFDGARIVAVAGVGNKAAPYDESDVRQLTLLMSGMWQILQRQRALEEIRKFNEDLERRVAERSAQWQAANQDLQREVAERQRAEEAQREQVHFLEVLLETLPNPIFYKDTRGVYLACNQAYLDFVGLPREKVIGWTLFEILPGPLAAQYSAADKELFEKGGMQQYESTVPRADGQARTIISYKAAFRRAGGSPGGLVGTLVDITERKQLEEHIGELNQALADRAAQLEAANKELEAFSYSVSHDLRAPLRAVDGFSQAVLEDYAGALDAQGQDSLRRVRAGTQRMGQLIDDLLKLSHLTRGELRRSQVNLSQTAEEIAAELRRNQPERQVDFVIAPDVAAEGDPRLLRIVLENLLGNAWKFTSVHPQARIEFGVLDAGRQRVYFVRDDGAGFSMAYADKLFAPFQRLHSAGEFPGTGIGLATVRRIIARHGGRVWAEGEEHKGALFCFTL